MQDRSMMKVAVKSLYQMQKLRVQQGNRIAAAFRYKLGLNPSQAEAENADAENLLNELRQEFKRITDGIKRITKNIKIDSPLITTMGELALLEAYERQLEAEALHEKAIADLLRYEPIWTQYLEQVRGCGVLMAGVIVSDIDIHKCNSISALWAYCGLDVVVSEKDGETLEEGRSRKKHHLKPKEYVNRDGEIVQTVGITFNPFLKTKLVGVLGTVFIKLGGPYREIYDGYKHRLENHPKHKDKTKGHRHNMAVRYMVKEFLADLWTEWRVLEGLLVRSRYAEEKLGIRHSKAA
jgi:hypothetical protein